MDEARLAEIEARANAATPGPWRSGGFYGLARANDGDTAGWSHGAALPMGRCSFCGDATEPCPMAVMYQSDRDAAPRTYHARWLASPNGEGWQKISSAATALAIAGNYDYDSGGVCSTPEDSAFIAHSRDDVPALVAEVRRLRAIIEGRTTPPTPGERVAHLRATGGDGRWRLRRGALDLIGAFHGSVLLADAMTATDARWWAIDADGRPCAWPTARGGE